jgi:glyoxalase family protein
MSESPVIGGIHHVTAIASDPQPNLDFYVRFLGLRLVKRTVNFDDPGAYHFYYGDRVGRPGTLLTFFPSPGLARGRHGTGQVTLTSLAVSRDSLSFWTGRAKSYGVEAVQAPERFGEPGIRIVDPGGLAIELTASAPVEGGEDGVDIPAEASIRFIGSATLSEAEPARTLDLLKETLGFRELAREDNRIRLIPGALSGGPAIEVTADPSARRGLSGSGTVHHVAFRTPDDAQQTAWRNVLLAAGYDVTPVMNRSYFKSIYFREPGGILFEIATDGPGFLTDETVDTLGRELKLPEMYEPMRGRIQRTLPPVTVPVTGLGTESY